MSKDRKVPDAEKLLGGYAADILSDEEKRVLFNAALERQEIFNALMDEEILKQILANPESRAKIMAALTEPAIESSTVSQKKIRPFWQKSLWMGVAAGAFLVFMTSYALKNKDVLPPPAKQPDSLEVEETTIEAVKEIEKKVVLANVRGSAAVEKKAAQTERTNARQEIPIQRQEDTDASPTPISTIDYSAVIATSPEVHKTQIMDTSIASAPTLPLHAQSSAQRAAPQIVSERVNKEASLKNKNAIGSIARTLEKTEISAEIKSISPDPVWTVERIDNGHLRVIVRRTEPNTEIVLLHRTSLGVRVVAPVRQGADVFHYEIKIADGDRLDLYQLRARSVEYLELPESGAVGGQRVRIYPRNN